MAKVESTEIADDEVLTQFGECVDGTLNFRGQPRPSESDVSMLRGRWERTDAGQRVRRRREPSVDAARYTTAVDLSSVGFAVRHTPSKMNPDHVSVKSEHGWTNDVVMAFVNCFDSLMDLPSASDVDKAEEGEDGA